jgi:hypothetical protein
LDEIQRKRKTNQNKTIPFYKNILAFKLFCLHLYNITAPYFQAIRGTLKTCDSPMCRHMTVLFTKCQTLNGNLQLFSFTGSEKYVATCGNITDIPPAPIL